MICADNTRTIQASQVSPTFLFTGRKLKSQNLRKFQVSSQIVSIVRPEDFIWLELSTVDEVERVFVERRGDSFQVMTVVNDRGPELRKRIFAREKAIIEELSQYEFDFDILTRMNHRLEDLVSSCDKPSYAR